LFIVRGTEAHVGASAQEEERLAQRLGAIQDEEGRYSRWDLWKYLGGEAKIGHFLHHIGTTGSQSYETTAVHKELIEAFVESARTRERPPDYVVRSHRHRYAKTEIPTSDGDAISCVTPGWQLKTPFSWKIAGARQTLPQIGGIVIRFAHGRLFADAKVWTVDRSPTE